MSPPLKEGPGLQLLLDSGDFGEWEQLVAGTLGHHRSRLLSGSIGFEARILAGAVDEFRVLWLSGSGTLELLREQCGHGVLWLPVQGLSQETINGEVHVAEPGMGLLFRPGDQMSGLTAERMQGVSILLPERHLQGSGPSSPLLYRGSTERQVLESARRLVEAASQQSPGASFAAEALVNDLWQLCNPPASDRRRGSLAAERRRSTVAGACLWMEDHLAERFSVMELSAALYVSVRTLQYSFQTELGCTPMAEAKRLRLRRLQRLLQNPELRNHGIAELMQMVGLLACGQTAADYRRWCGESPRRTRQIAMARYT